MQDSTGRCEECIRLDETRANLLKTQSDVHELYTQLSEKDTRPSEEYIRLVEESDRLQEERDCVLRQGISQTRLLFSKNCEHIAPVPPAPSDPKQGTLFDAPPLVEHSAPPRRKRRNPHTRLRLRDIPVTVPRERIFLEPGEDITTLKCIGQEETWHLDMDREKVKVKELVRRKYADEDRGVIMAKLPARLRVQGRAGPGLMASSVYDWKVPLPELIQQFNRVGIPFSASALSGWIIRVSGNLKPLYDLLKQQVRASGYLKAEETLVPVQDRAKKGKMHRGYCWTYLAPEPALVVVEYGKARDRPGPMGFLKTFNGALQTDGYPIYDTFDTHPSITTYGCMEHTRRTFQECLGADPDQREYVLEQIQGVYSIEQQLREDDANADRRRAVRQREAKPILVALEQWLRGQTASRRSPWGQVVHYTLRRWDKLTRYLNDGRIQIDNNPVEGTLPPLTLGLKKSVFAGSHQGAQRAAVLYSLIGTCILHNVDSQDWLTDVLTRLPSQPSHRIHKLLPQNWEEARSYAEL